MTGWYAGNYVEFEAGVHCMCRAKDAAIHLVRTQGLQGLEQKIFAVKKLHEVPQHLHFLFKDDGWQFQHIVAYCDCLETLCQCSREELTSRTKGEYTPLHYAIHGGSVECVAYLLGAMKAQFPNMKDEWLRVVEQGCQMQSLKLAVMARCPKIVKMLLDYGAVVSEGDYANLLQMALGNHDHESHRLILPVYLNHCGNKERANLLATAIETRQFDTIPDLLGAGECLVGGDKSPLECACRYGDNAETLALLKELCAKSGRIEDDHNDTEGPAHWACQLGSPEILRLFLNHGASITRLDKNRMTCAIRLLRSRKNSDTIIECLKILKDTHKFDLNEPRYPTVLSEALTSVKAQSFVDVVEWLLKNGADFSLPCDKTRQTTCLQKLNQMMARDSVWRDKLQNVINETINTQATVSNTNP